MDKDMFRFYAFLSVLILAGAGIIAYGVVNQKQKEKHKSQFDCIVRVPDGRCAKEYLTNIADIVEKDGKIYFNSEGKAVCVSGHYTVILTRNPQK